MPRLLAPRSEAFAALAKLDAEITASRFYRPSRELISHEGLADSIGAERVYQEWFSAEDR